MSRYPLEGYREKCATDVVLGNRFASKPLKLKIPITIAGMSFGFALRTCQRVARLWGDLGRDIDHDRRWRDDARRTGTLAVAGISVPALPLRDEPG